MKYSNVIAGSGGMGAVGEQRVVEARFGLTQELKRSLPLTRLYWSRERRECGG